MLVAGIGPEAAALCTTYITECASLVKDFIYLGTSGWSAQQGGILNAPSSCAAANGITPRNREASPPLRRDRKELLKCSDSTAKGGHLRPLGSCAAISDSQVKESFLLMAFLASGRV